MTAPATATRHVRPPRPSVPRRGHVLTSIAEAYGGPIRLAVAKIAAILDRQKLDLCPSLPVIAGSSLGSAIVNRRPAEIAAWHLCTQWVVGNALGALRPESSLEDAATWFAGSETGTFGAAAAELEEQCLGAVRSIAEPTVFADLLPYILDPHGPGSRLSVMRDATTQAARAEKRAHGVFYTPADVADYMTGLALAHLAPCHPVTVLDPACGTGVYLRAVLAALIAKHPTADPITLAEQSLFGVDIDPWAVDAAAYVLLHDVLTRETPRGLTPAATWRRLRLNLRVADALQIDPARGSGEALGEADRNRSQVNQNSELPGIVAPQGERLQIDHVFPRIGTGPRIVLGNPPYAGLGQRRDRSSLADHFETLGPGGSAADLHPLFVEQMVRLSAPESSGALVLPLSIAFNTRRQYAALRRLVQETPGNWRFSFFDREPHALFGEDVKTRNAIVAWSRTCNDTDARILTGPLLKWRGSSRARMFAAIRFTPIKGSVADGIPKLGGAPQAQALTGLRTAHARAAMLHRTISIVKLADCFSADNSTVFVGSTAYNFLNVFMRPPARLQPEGDLSTNTIYAVRTRRSADAPVLFALLSSRIAFWLWHVLGDGFHVTRAFLEDVPLAAAQVSDTDRAALAELGTALWHEVRTRPVLSKNRGRQSLGFSAARSPDLQRRIDQIIIDAGALPAAFASDLDQFIQSVVAANPCGAVEAANPEDYAA